MTKWNQPVEVSDSDTLFGGDLQKLLPPYSDIPIEFKNYNNRTKWNKVQFLWFHEGLSKDNKFFPKKNVNLKKAIRHLSAIQHSRECRYEEKEAGVSYLMSLWFDDIVF